MWRTTKRIIHDLPDLRVKSLCWNCTGNLCDLCVWNHGREHTISAVLVVGVVFGVFNVALVIVDLVSEISRE